MTGGEKTIRHKALDDLWEVEETKGVSDGRARLRENLREFLLGKILLLDQLLIATSLFDRGKVRPLQILDKSKLKDILVRNLSNNNRNLFETSKLGSLIPTLASDDFVVVANFANQKRLKDTILFNGVRELIKLLLIKLTARLIWIRLNLRNIKNRVRLHCRGLRGSLSN